MKSEIKEILQRLNREQREYDKGNLTEADKDNSYNTGTFLIMTYLFDSLPEKEMYG